MLMFSSFNKKNQNKTKQMYATLKFIFCCWDLSCQNNKEMINNKEKCKSQNCEQDLFQIQWQF